MFLTDKNYDAYQTEMRSVFECYARRDDKERFYAYVSSDESFRHMDRETIEVIGRLTNAQELLDIIDENEEEEECDVCKAIKDLIEDGRIEGRKEGRVEGINFVKDVANRLGAGESEEMLLAEVEEEERETCKAITDLIEDGRKEGRAEGALKILIELANDGSISIKEAAQKSGMDEDKFREKMKL